ncbi:MAG: hypothetical protein ACT4N4_03785 [Rhodospirillales bacterium]
MHRRMTAIGSISTGRALALAGMAVAAALAPAPAAGPAAAAQISIRCQHELSPAPSVWIFDTANPEGYFDDGKLRRANILFAGSQITIKQVEEQPVCHLGSGCTNGKTITEFTTVINRTNNTFLVYCKNIRDDANNWKPGANCFPKGPSKGRCLKD